MDNKMQIEISIKDNLTKQLAQMSESVKKAANVMKQQVNAIQEAFNNIKIKTNVSQQANYINKEIDNLGKKTKSIQINIKARLDSSGLSGLNIKDKEVKVTVDVNDDEIEKTFKNIDVEIKDIENDFEDLDIKSDIVKQIKDIIKEINGIGNKVKDIEIDIKADLDESDLMADLKSFNGEVNVKANVNGLNNLNQDVDIDANVKSSGLDNITDMAQMGMASSIKNMSMSIKQMASAIKQTFDNGVKDSKQYQNALDNIRQTYVKMKKLQSNIGIGNSENWETKEVTDSIIEMESSLRAAQKQFELFGNSMDIPQAKECLETIKELREALFNIGTKKIDTESLDALIKKMNLANKTNINPTVKKSHINQAVKEAVKLGDLIKELESKKLTIQYEIEGNIGHLEDQISGAESGEFKIDTSELEKLKKDLEELKQRKADLNSEIEKLSNQIQKSTNKFNNLDFVLQQNGINSSKLKRCFETLANALATVKQKISGVTADTSKLNSIFQSLKAKLGEFGSKAAAPFANLKQKIAEIIPDANAIGSRLDALQAKIEQYASIAMTALGKIRSSKLLPETTEFNTTIQSLKTGISNFTGYTFTAFNNLKDRMLQLTTISGKIGTAFNGLKDKIGGITSKIGEQFTKLKNNISSSVTNATTKAFEKLKSTLSNLSPVLTKVGNGFVNLCTKMSKTKVISNTLNKVFSLFKTTLGKLGLAFGAYQLINFGKQAIQTASSVEEAQNVIDVTFGKSADTISKWAKENAGAFGLTELQAKNFAGTFGTIFQASGVNMSYVDDMSMKLSQLAGDLASFRNLTVDDAFEKLRNGITGSVEPLQSLGYNMSVATMDAYLMSQGINVAFSDLSEASKQVVRFNYIMQQTKGIQGDYINTMNSFSNSVRNLKNSFSVLCSEVGQTLIAALAPVVRAIATVIQWLTALARVFNSVLRGFGLIKGEASSASTAISGISSGIGGGSSGIEDTAGSIGGIGDSADDSSESVKNLKKEIKGLMGIDEINKLPAPQEDSDSGKGGKGGSGSGPGGGGGVDVPVDLGLIPNIDDNYTGIIEDKIEEMMEKIKAYLNTFDWEPLKNSFMRLYESLKPTIEMIGKVIGWFWEEILNPLIHFTIEDVLPRFFETLANVINMLNPILEVVLQNFKVLWDEVLEPIAKWVGDKFLDFWDWLNKHLKNFGDYLNENKTAAKILGDIASALLLMWGGSKVIAGGSKVVGIIKKVITWVHHLFKFITGSSIVKALGSLFKGIGPLFTKLGGWIAKAGGLFTKLWGVIKAIGSAIMAGITAIATALNIPVAAVIAIIAAIAAVVAVVIIYWDEICAWCKKTWNKFTKWFSKTCKNIGKWFKELWQDIKNIWNKVADWFTNLFKKAWNGIKSAWSTVKNWFKDLWESIKNTWKEVTQWFSNLFKNAWNGIKDAWSSVKSWFSDLWEGIKNIWKEVTQWFTNLFANAWNGIKNAWSTVKQWFANLWDGIKNIWKEVTQWFTNLFTNAWTGIKNAWASVKQWFSNLWEGIKSVFSNVGTWFSNIFTTAWNGIKTAWSGVTNWFSGIWTGIKNAFSGVGTWFSNIFASARDGIKNVWSNIKSFLTSPIESAKTAISNVINKIKGLFNFNWSLPRIKLPHFSISPPGWEFGDLLKGSIPKLGIEWYANGGIMTNPTAFGVNGNNLMVGGEAGAEAIVPLNTLWEQMDKFANKIVQGTNTNNNRPIDIHNELFLDGNKVADSVIKNINRQTKLNGRSPLK